MIEGMIDVKNVAYIKKLRNNEEETLGNDEEFMSLFGCLKDEPLEIPEDKPAKVDEWKEWF